MPYIILCNGRFVKKTDSLSAMSTGGLTSVSNRADATKFTTKGRAEAYASDWKEVEYARGIKTSRIKIIEVS